MREGMLAGLAPLNAAGYFVASYLMLAQHYRCGAGMALSGSSGILLCAGSHAGAAASAHLRLRSSGDCCRLPDHCGSVEAAHALDHAGLAGRSGCVDLGRAPRTQSVAPRIRTDMRLCWEFCAARARRLRRSATAYSERPVRSVSAWRSRPWLCLPITRESRAVKRIVSGQQ